MLGGALFFIALSKKSKVWFDIRGMRIRVRDVLELYAAGLSSEQILADYPDLEPEDLSAALDYAAREIDHPVLVG